MEELDHDEFMRDFSDDEDGGDEDYAPENYSVLSINDSQVMEVKTISGDYIDTYDIDSIYLSFPDAENGVQETGQEERPLGWVNSATVNLDRSEDSVSFSISVGDPRGAFVFTVRRLPNGRLVMHVPYPNEPLPHRPLTWAQAGTYEIG